MPPRDQGEQWTKNMPPRHRQKPVITKYNQLIHALLDVDLIYQEIHAAEPNETLVNWSRTSASPQCSDFLDASAVKHVCTIKLDRRGQEKESPLASRYVTSPHRFHEKGPGRIPILNQAHEDDTDYKGRYTNNDSKYESPEKGTLFPGLH